ncbi:MAG: CRTAC1 family protein [Planctomycetota bacterium]|jgi:hypothetical protein
MSTWRSRPRLPALAVVGGRATAPLTVGLALAGCDPPPGHDLAPDHPPESSWLVDVAGELGLDFVHASGGTGDFRMPEIMGPGAALLDVDGDGDLDAYLVSGHGDGLGEGRAGAASNRLYLQGPDGRFVDATAGSGLDDRGYGMGVAAGDIDNDGDVDLYVTNHGPDRLYRNRGDGTFEDVTARAGIDVPGWSCSAEFVDYDRDGRLDLYVTQYVDFDPALRCHTSAGEPDYCGPKAMPPRPDVLLRNTGTPDGPAFEDVSAAAGLRAVAPAAGLGVIADDLDDDGWPDLYVANDAYANHLWLNRGDGTFREAAMALGVAYNLHGQAEAGMGVVAEDLDGDGRTDLLVTHLGQETNTLYVGHAAGFDDATGASGLGTASMSRTGFGVVALDLELDGDLDVAIGNGRVVRGTPLPDTRLPSPWSMFAEPNLLHVNEGGGRFRDAAGSAPGFCADPEITRGLVAGDVDGDGDLDLLAVNTEGPARLYRNDAPRAGAWLAVRAVDPALGRDAIGARVVVATTDGRRRVRTIRRGGSYLSCGDARAHFGLGPEPTIAHVDVRWPDGTVERFPSPAVDASVVLERGSGGPAS